MSSDCATIRALWSGPSRRIDRRAAPGHSVHERDALVIALWLTQNWVAPKKGAAGALHPALMGRDQARRGLTLLLRRVSKLREPSSIVVITPVG